MKYPYTGSQVKIHVQGLWHLGSVTAACLASAGHNVIGLDFDDTVIKSLSSGKSVIFEPGLDELIQKGLESKKLSFSSSAQNIEFLWVTYDTPVDKNDNADVDFVISNILKMKPFLADDALILISSQMPIGSVKLLEDKFKDINVSFAYSPENLRLGNAINVFMNPDRIVVGVRSEKDKLKIKNILGTITDKIEWMSVESAEMTKHAINSFLATSVTFANEIASLCEVTGADAKEVERGLKTEQRIGPKAYLSPGVAFSGGTLARDIEFLKQISYKNKLSIPVIESVKISNDNHKDWAKHKIKKLVSNLDDLKQTTITIWGLAYKEGTDTLRRSLTVELCNWLIDWGTIVNIYDTTVQELPTNWKLCDNVKKYTTLEESLISSDILVIGTKNEQYNNFFKTYTNDKLIVIDPNRYLANLNIKNYISIGTPK